MHVRPGSHRHQHSRRTRTAGHGRAAQRAWARRSPDAGFAVLVTVVIMAVVFSLVGMVGSQVLVTDSATTISNVDYQQALQSAQSGVDAAYQRIESEASVKTAPCGATAVRGTLGSAPRSSSYSVTATYFSTLTARTKLACSSLSAASKATTLPKAVLLTSTGKDGTKSARVVSEADIAVSPLGSVFGDAAYIGAGFTVSGADAFDTPTKTVYVNGSVKCGSGGSMTGTLVATGNMTLTGNCKIAGNAKAGGAISIPSGSPSVGGTLVSFSTATPGIDIAGNPTLHGVVAKTKITTPSWWPGTHPAAHIVEDDSSLGSLTTQTFPKVIWTPSGWVASGYRALNAGSTCAKVYKAMFAMHTASTATGTSKPVALYTSCKVTLPQRHPNCPSWQTAYYCTKLVLARNLVVLSTAGFDLPTPANVSVSTAGATHQLGLIVPTDKSTGSPVSCTGTNGLITFTGKIYTGVDTLFYTPCKISMTGSAKVVEGEIYAGSTYTAENGMAFGSPLTVAGASGGSRSVAGKASVGVLFVRQAS